MNATMKQTLSDIVLRITWRDIARNYFGKSSSWLYHKLDGKPSGFSPEEAQMLKNALHDLAEKIHTAADRI